MIREEKTEYYKYLKYIIENKEVGYLEYKKSFEIIDITDIFVKEEFRNKQIASHLINKLTKNYDTSKIMLEVNINNKPAINLYKKFKFKQIHIRKNYYNDEDAIIMEKLI